MSDISRTKPSIWKQIVKNRSSYFFMAGFLLVFTVFTVVPVIIAIALSFTHFNVLESPYLVGLENYLNLFLRDSVFVIDRKSVV